MAHVRRKFTDAQALHLRESQKAIEYIQLLYELEANLKAKNASPEETAVERGQRPSVMGRKNYLFCKNHSSAEDNAVFYSLLESCQIVGINPLRWISGTLQRLADNPAEEMLQDLLPYNYKKSQE